VLISGGNSSLVVDVLSVTGCLSWLLVVRGC
jgi:hypothetical protein